MEIRYLDLKDISPEIYTALWEYDRVIELKEPTLIKFIPKDTIIQFWQGPYWDDKTKSWKEDFTNMEVFYNSESIRNEIKVRCYIPIEIPYSAEISYYVASKYGTDFILYVPKSTKEQRGKLDLMFQQTMVEVLAERHIDSKINGNDVLFWHDNKYKKFSGSIYRPASNGYGYVDNGITYQFDSELANKLRRIKTKGINIKKFDVDDISDSVGGLWEVNSNIDKDDLDFEVADLMCHKLGYTIRHDTLSQKEHNTLFDRGKRRMTEEKWYLHGNNDDFQLIT